MTSIMALIIIIIIIITARVLIRCAIGVCIEYTYDCTVLLLNRVFKIRESLKSWGIVYVYINIAAGNDIQEYKNN